jgi:NAD(P)H-dependent FMN reductase
MLPEKRCEVRVLVFGASLRQGSLSDRLAAAAARVVEENGGMADLAIMLDIDCPRTTATSSATKACLPERNGCATA